MRRAIVILALCSICAACSSHGSGPTSLPPLNNGGGPPPDSPTPTPTATPTQAPTFNPSRVSISEHAVPTLPEYLAVTSDGDVFFGNGQSGGGSNLYRYAGGSFSQTQPAPPPSGYSPLGGVYGVSAVSSGLFWLSAYQGPSEAPYVAVECGAGSAATLCEPTVDEPTTMLVDRSGTFWVGGYGFNGGGVIATSTQAQGQFAGGIAQLVLGPGGAVWGIENNYPSYAIAEFTASGGTVSAAQTFALPSGDAAGSLTYGGDGALWFTDQQTNAIGRMDSTGAVTEYPLRSPNALGQPWYGLWQIATACDGSVWFTEPQTNKIGRIDAHGGIVEFTMPTAQSAPDAIAARKISKCSGTALWVAEQNADKIAGISF